MTADVAEGAECAFFVADDNNGLTYEIRSEETFRVGDGPLYPVHFPACLVKGSNELPRAAKNARFLDFQNRGVGVETRCERLRTLDLFVHVKVQWSRDHKEKLRTCVFAGATSARPRFWIR